jgi:glycosyl hydrolase family 2
LLLSHFGLKPIEDALLEFTLENFGAGTVSNSILQCVIQTNINQNPGTLAQLAGVEWSAPETTTPVHLLARAVFQTKEGQFQNEWPLWVVPKPPPEAMKDVVVHSSLDPAQARELLPACQEFKTPGVNTVVVASHFDDELARFVETGGRLLLLPDGQRHSFALSSHWFLRGAPYTPHHALSGKIPRELLVELQHFDLASRVVPDLPHLDSFDPLLLLWDTHDQRSVKTHGLVFETRIGKGRMLVSALRHDGANNAVGRWLLSLFVGHLRSAEEPRHSLNNEVWNYAKARLHAEQTNLVSRTWLFKPDPQNEGLAKGWHSPHLASEADWKEIRIGAWWESQGYPALDGWAWYRLRVDIPSKWARQDVFLSFEGVDDIYELYVNGELAGKGGDLATRKDALSEKKSHNITKLVKPGETAVIAVRVHDWYGAGGIFRPVTLGTLAFSPELDLLK